MALEACDITQDMLVKLAGSAKKVSGSMTDVADTFQDAIAKLPNCLVDSRVCCKRVFVVLAFVFVAFVFVVCCVCRVLCLLWLVFAVFVFVAFAFALCLTNVVFAAFVFESLNVSCWVCFLFNTVFVGRCVCCVSL